MTTFGKFRNYQSGYVIFVFHSLSITFVHDPTIQSTQAALVHFLWFDGLRFLSQRRCEPAQ